jgi:hypothetical protein
LSGIVFLLRFEFFFALFRDVTRLFGGAERSRARAARSSRPLTASTAGTKAVIWERRGQAEEKCGRRYAGLKQD